MKNILILLLLPNFLFAELLLEITKGSDNPYRIAIVPFEGADKSVSTMVDIIKADLIRSGEFFSLSEEMLLSIPKTINDIKPSEWKLLNIDFIVIGKVINEDNISLKASYEIYDVNKKSKIRSSTVYGIPGKLRQLAHYISDGIYESVTGMKGISATKILYVNEVRDGLQINYILYVADADGSNEAVLLKSNEPIISPAWSPDSKKIAYVSFETGMAKVFIQDIGTGKRELVLINDNQVSSPAWSPDGKLLSLTLYQDGNAEIYILNLANKNLTRLTKHYSIDTESSWSTKGTKILFTSGRSGSPQLYEIDLTKLNAKPSRLTFEGNYNAKGSYLPNDEGIIFVHRSKDQFQIALKYLNENFIRPLTESKMDESPSVSPNGNVIVYAITDNKSGMIAGVTLSGATFVLPATNGKVREPAWSGFLR
ncbi:Tol-Pal system beta propeller repeat protein TolB [Gammaproteobacteria bacterium]|nr:Tol-Pal system beta propeller repeat protein TolB [Gammaproteobacteria bacterium]